MGTRTVIGTLAFVLVMFATALARDAAGGRIAWERDIAAATARAKTDHHPMLLYFTHDDSEPDRAFDRGALSDDAVVAMSRDFVCVLVDCTGTSGFVRADAKALPVMEKHGVGSFPTVVLFAADGTRAGGHVGVCTPDVLKERMSQAKKPPGPSVRMEGFEFLGWNPSGQEEYRCAKDGAAMVLVPGGEFPAGEGEGGECRLRVEPFLLDRTEVSNAQYSKFLEATKGTQSEPLLGKEWLAKELSVSGVTWEQAVAYATWCGRRLPSEAEWEKAARGTDARPYPWGRERQPWIYIPEKDPLTKENNPPQPGGSTLWDISPYGLRDMGGNPGEWCADEYRSDFYGKSHPNPVTRAIDAAGGHTARSECMCNRRICPHEVWSRSRGDHSNLAFAISFRCAVTVPASGWVRPAPRD